MGKQVETAAEQPLATDHSTGLMIADAKLPVHTGLMMPQTATILDEEFARGRAHSS